MVAFLVGLLTGIILLLVSGWAAMRHERMAVRRGLSVVSGDASE